MRNPGFYYGLLLYWWLWDFFYFTKYLLCSKILNAIKALEDEGFALSVSGGIKGTEEPWDRSWAVGLALTWGLTFKH